LLGPSTLRDTLALPVDRRGDPVQDINPQASRNATYLLRAVDARSNLLRASADEAPDALIKRLSTDEAPDV
jgi:phospholipid-binding lipoprotein MlaA